MSYIYHFCAVTRPDGVALKYSSGFITLPSMVSASDDVENVQKIVAGHVGTNEFAIASLTLLNPPFPPCGQPAG